MRARVRNAREPERLQVLRGLQHPGRVGRRRLELLRELELGDVAAPLVEDLRLGLVGGHPAHHLGGCDQRVVGAEGHGAVAGRALDHEPPPVDALLSDRHRQLDARGRRNGHAAAFGDHVIGLDHVELLACQVAGAVDAAGLLIGDGEVDQRPPRLEAALGQPARGHRHGGRDVEHVGRAASPHHAVHDLGHERIALPA